MLLRILFTMKPMITTRGVFRVFQTARLPTEILWSGKTQDLMRTLDYLETRPDIDSYRVGYYGVSWGGRRGPLIMALESRLKTGVLIVGGCL